MVKLLKRFVLSVLLLTSASSLANQKIVICMDQTWFPYTYVSSNSQIRGIHTDIIKMALNQLRINYIIKPKPWKRCLVEAQQGLVDAVATASYKPQRAEFLLYPKDAGTKLRSNWRVMQVEWSLVTPVKEKYLYTGNLQTIPQPIYVPLGYSIGKTLVDEGLNVDSGSVTDENNFRKITRTLKGSLVASTKVTEYYMNKLELNGILIINKQPIKTKSYFLVFSKKSAHKAVREAVWERIRIIREKYLQKLLLIELAVQ
ncbi:transporter substrate-binding domain-containing protein [Piscirickettsia salmonis]|uniref:transporter substrate-binding domain-containing protein n=1 Tax=Piscirickettsia salmonis TaxID=1238 RepID=UPI0012BA658F|nr:transporter substrate-binding domain-containing protein [Piscirickettsia salmonis]QGP56930.1 Bacterial extracellular solute-binding protein, family 3 [Piscirickettsia salmonis]QGP61611.1 Bacterial extracellular solute-binding protein, family 3 [Piscirickettsia salmonis]QGP66474.1 Bacterial extracellular solute-binding protein, family 3 [Piscirickettsia salmonis]